ncbi:hypothetical protein CISG_04034 [Coccidioides immitis RMSCC 3703]|uniref:Uncharacterized protein n=1 Tax=Coccidioides immitis RMSCC 3703 TaxID=454286 RepID=A0A0J8QPK5_COCIT|nr:hypothetical protein CISG_04034 [Coccidioides immitis RMSCC 3703]
MSLYYYQQHEVFPVEVLSVYGGQARILIGYFDGKHLCIQKSPIYDIGSEGLQNWILLMKWWFSDAAGDTTPPSIPSRYQRLAKPCCASRSCASGSLHSPRLHKTIMNNNNNFSMIIITLSVGAALWGSA